MRLLSYPDFLERLAERVARLRERFGWLSGSKGATKGGPRKRLSFGLSGSLFAHRRALRPERRHFLSSF